MLDHIARTLLVAMFFASALVEARSAEPSTPAPADRQDAPPAQWRNDRGKNHQFRRILHRRFAQRPDSAQTRRCRYDLQQSRGRLSAKSGPLFRWAMSTIISNWPSGACTTICWARHRRIGRRQDCRSDQPHDRRVAESSEAGDGASPALRGEKLAAAGSIERRIGSNDPRTAPWSRRNVHPVGPARAVEPLHKLRLPRRTIAAGLQLYRVPIGASASRRITQRNLYAVLQFIDVDNPSASKLLTAVREPHGTARYAIFAEHQASQYQRLADWVNQIAQPTMLRPARHGRSHRAGQGGRNAFRWSRAGIALAGCRKDGASNDRADRWRSAHRGPTAAKGNHSVTPATFNEPADPFDPEVFNRRYAPPKPATTRSQNSRRAVLSLVLARWWDAAKTWRASSPAKRWAHTFGPLNQRVGKFLLECIECFSGRRGGRRQR